MLSQNRTNVRREAITVNVQAPERLEPYDRAAGSLADAVRTRRRILGLRQDDLADLAGVSERFVYAVERGKQSVQLDKLMSVLSVLGLHLEVRPGAARSVRVSVEGAPHNPAQDAPS